MLSIDEAQLGPHRDGVAKGEQRMGEHAEYVADVLTDQIVDDGLCEIGSRHLVRLLLIDRLA